MSEPNIGPMKLVTREELEKLKAEKKAFNQLWIRAQMLFPSREELEQILRQHYPDLDEEEFKLLMDEQNRRKRKVVRDIVHGNSPMPSISAAHAPGLPTTEQ